MHDLIGLGDQLADHIQLVSCSRNWLIFHRPQLHRQILRIPLRVCRVVHFRRGQFEQVPNAPGHHVLTTLDTAASTLTAAQRLGDDLPELGFLRNEQPHITSLPTLPRTTDSRIRGKPTGPPARKEMVCDVKNADGNLSSDFRYRLFRLARFASLGQRLGVGTHQLLASPQGGGRYASMPPPHADPTGRAP